MAIFLVSVAQFAGLRGAQARHAANLERRARPATECPTGFVDPVGATGPFKYFLNRSYTGESSTVKGGCAYRVESRTLSTAVELSSGTYYQEGVLAVSNALTVKKGALITVCGTASGEECFGAPTGIGNLMVTGTVSIAGGAYGVCGASPTYGVEVLKGGTFSSAGGFLSCTGNWYLKIEKGANASLTAKTTLKGATTTVDGGSLRAQDSAIKDCGGVGVTVKNGGTSTLTQDTFDDCGTAPVQYKFCPKVLNDSGLRSTSSSINAVLIPAGAVKGKTTWTNPGIPIDIVPGGSAGGNLGIPAKDSLVVSGGSLWLQGGVYIAKSANLELRNLTVTSPPAESGQTGFAGIEFLPGSKGVLANDTVSTGGTLPLMDEDGANHYAGIVISGSSPVILTTTITKSGGNGIEVIHNGTPTLAYDTATNNAGVAFQYDFPSDAISRDRLLKASENAGGSAALYSNGMRVYGGSAGLTYTSKLKAPDSLGVPLTFDGGGTGTVIGGSFDLSSSDHPYKVQFINGNATVSPGGNLMVDRRHVAFLSNALRVYGKFEATGATLNSAAATPAKGDWQGIVFEPKSTGTIAKSALEWAGAQMGISDCGGDTVYYTSVLVCGVSPTVSGTSITNGNGSDVVVSSGQPVLSPNNSFGSVPAGQYGVLNKKGSSGPPIDATKDWWAAASGPDAPDNPVGTGTPASDGVNFASFLTKAPLRS